MEHLSIDNGKLSKETLPMQLNQIARVVLTTAKELFFDPYQKNKATGSFILIDPITNNTSAVGMIIDRVEDKDMHLAEDLPILNLPQLGIAPEHYEAIEKAQKEKFDVILIDTAGRLQNKFNLMEELKKIKSVIDKKAPEALRECILVLDANTGQNGLQQAKVFTEAVNITSVALTKLDGSAKGAIILAVAKDMKLPVKLVGVGEKMEDLKTFNSEDFINALFE